MSNRRIRVSELDFDQIKENLKDFLRGQSQFSDYDFEGSNMSVLLDVLAYNTHYNALYTNLAINEVFLDSASKRDSVVSLAKGLGYTPRSAYSARTVVDFKVVNTIDALPFLTITKNSPFNGQIDSSRFVFYTNKDITVAKDENNEYVFEDVELVEGIPLRNRLQYTEDNRYVIPNANIDTSTLKVRIQETINSSSYTTYTLADLQGTVDGESQVYFIKETDSGFYELFFGDGILGKPLQSGNVINIEYFVSSGFAANGIKTLQYGGTRPNGGSIANISLQFQTSGGREPETTDEIRFNAPNLYASQNRAVTATDYEAIILNKVPAIEDVVVWGGENNMPPAYGKIFISASTKTGISLSFEEKRDIIENTLDKFKVVGTVPEFVTPEYIDIQLDVIFYYDQTTTTKSLTDLRTIATELLFEYNNSQLKKFNKIFRSSAISRIIDSVDPSITSSSIRTKMVKTVPVIFNKNTNYSIVFGNPIEPRSLQSTQVISVSSPNPIAFYEDGDGILKYYEVVQGLKVDKGEIGTIDYSRGIVSINSISIFSLPFEEFKISVRPDTFDIISIFNQIVRIDTSILTVSPIVDNSTQGRTLSGNKYIFSSNKI
jgi:hypothetical protein